jgi:hypothetical protein
VNGYNFLTNVTSNSRASGGIILPLPNNLTASAALLGNIPIRWLRGQQNFTGDPPPVINNPTAGAVKICGKILS